MPFLLSPLLNQRSFCKIYLFRTYFKDGPFSISIIVRVIYDTLLAKPVFERLSLAEVVVLAGDFCSAQPSFILRLPDEMSKTTLNVLFDPTVLL